MFMQQVLYPCSHFSALFSKDCVCLYMIVEGDQGRWIPLELELVVVLSQPPDMGTKPGSSVRNKCFQPLSHHPSLPKNISDTGHF